MDLSCGEVDDRRAAGHGIRAFSIAAFRSSNEAMVIDDDRMALFRGLAGCLWFPMMWMVDLASMATL